MLKQLLTACLFLVAFNARAQYLETFSTPNKGYLLNFVNDFSGVNWTMTPWANQPPAAFGRDDADYFQTTAAGVLECIDLDQEVSWESPLLNTAAAANLSLSVGLSWVGFDTDISGDPCTEASIDYIKVQYSVNGGAYTTIPNKAGGSACATIGYLFGTPNAPFSGSMTVTQAGIPGGSTLRIRVCVNVNVNGEIVTIDNVSVPTAGVTLGCSAPALSTAVTNITCGGANSGAIDLSVSGGTPGYTYNWSNGSTAQDIGNLTTGTYTVTVTDAGSCTATATAMVSAVPFSVSTQVGGVTCPGAKDGEIDLSVAGGKLPYSYAWSDLPNPGDPQDRTGLATGTHTVTVTDSGVCTATASATVGVAPGGPYLETFSTDGKGLLPGSTCSGPSAESCTNNNFAGVKWSIYSPDNLTGIETDDYFQTTGGKLEGKDFDQIICWESPAIDINPPGTGVAFSLDLSWAGFDQEPAGPNPPDLVADHIDVEYRLDDGAWTRVANQTGGGLTGHTIVYINGSGNDLNGSKTVTVTGLGGGKLQIRVCGYINSDAELMTLDNVSAPSANGLYCPVPQLSTAVTNVACFGGSNGAIELTVNGGTPGYTYLWSNGAVTGNLSNIPAGIYTVTVTDNAGFTNTATAIVDQGSELMVTAAVSKPVSCFGGSDGQITASASGGFPGYTFIWSNGVNTAANPNLHSGVYSVTATDSKGCAGSASNIVLSDPTPVTATPTYNPNACPNNPSTLTVSNFAGGAGAPYQFSVNNGVLMPPNFSVSLDTGTYVLTYFDRLFCEYKDTIQITRYPSANAVILGPDVVCLGVPQMFTLVGAFTNYNWTATNNGVITQGQGTDVPTVLWTESGNAVLTAYFTNAYGCTDTAAIPVLVNLCDGTAEIGLPGVQISPNPFTDVLSLRFERPVLSGTRLRLHDIQGKLLLERAVSDTDMRIDTGFLAPGAYLLQVVESGRSGIWRLVKI